MGATQRPATIRPQLPLPRRQKVLKSFYALAQGGSTAAGYAGMATRMKKIKNVDVTKQVSDHSAYCQALSLE